MIIKFVPTEFPAGKRADAELHFTSGPLDGLKLVGFSIWEKRGGAGLNVAYPARQYSVNGDRRSYALLRVIADVANQDRLTAAILDAYEEHQANVARAEAK